MHPIFTDSNLVQVVTHFDNDNKMMTIQHPAFVAMLDNDWSEAFDAYFIEDEYGQWLPQSFIDQIKESAKREFSSTAFIPFS